MKTKKRTIYFQQRHIERASEHHNPSRKLMTNRENEAEKFSQKYAKIKRGKRGLGGKKKEKNKTKLLPS